MQYLKKGILFTTVALALTSCSEDNPWSGSQEEGGIRLQLSADGKVFVGGDRTRADEGIKVPEASEFKLRMAKTDGSAEKTYNSLEEFQNEEAFPIGEYYLEAFYGDINEEGYGKPYFFGRQTVQVKPAVVTDAEVTATLANAMVSVSYSDDFKREYPSYSASFSTTGNPVYVVQDDSRVVYMKPGTVNITLSLTNSAGKSVTFTPASFTAEAQHRYNVKFGLEGGGSSGNSLSLKIIFDDNVDSEVVEVDLTDDFFNSPAPEVRPVGFNAGETFSIISGEKLQQRPRFHVFAFGGLKEANLTVSSTGVKTPYVPAFGSAVNLVGADAAMQAKLTAEGIDAAGFYRNPDKMAILELTDFISRLPFGTHTINFNAIDAYTRTSEQVSLVVTVGELSINAEVVENPLFQAEEMNVYVSTNSPAVKDKISFEVSNSEGAMKPAVIKSVEDVTSRADSYRYKYVIAIEKNNTTKIDVNVKNDGRLVRSFSVEKSVPEYSAAVDAFARHIVIKVTPENPSDLATVVNALSVWVGNNELPNGNITRDASAGIIKVAGFSASTAYSTVQIGIGKTSRKDIPAFTTEADTQVPNGDFSQTHETINIGSIQTGGQYTGTVFSNPKYTLHSSIIASEPAGWSSVNAKTCYTGSSNQNTWFLVPSTFVENGAVKLRNVGYNHNGTTPDFTKETSVYYSKNAPTFGDGNKAAGELFLGSYSFDGTENRVNGISFSSRPSYLSFDYSYSPVGNEKGAVTVEILDAAGSRIAYIEKNLDAASSTVQESLSLDNYEFGKKAAILRICFKSSNAQVPSINVPSGTALRENSVNAGNFTNPPAIAANSYKAVATGSVLTIDNVKLGYGSASTRAMKSKSKTVNRRRK